VEREEKREIASHVMRGRVLFNTLSLLCGRGEKRGGGGEPFLKKVWGD